MGDRCTRYGGECIGCGECDFERKHADVLSVEEIDKRIEALRGLRKSLHRELKSRKVDVK